VITKIFKKYLIILFLFLFFIFYFFESYLSLISKNQSRSDIYKYLINQNNKVGLTVGPNTYLNKNYKLFPLSGISNTKTVYCNENGYFSIYQSDRYGFNNPDDEWNNKKVKFLLIGDSFTHGACVNRPEDIASNLRLLSNKSVLNLGYGGNGPLIEFATLREYLLPRVEMVFWMYLEGNDLYNLKNEIKNKTLIKYLNDFSYTQNLRFKQNEIDKIANTIVNKEILNDNFQLYKHSQLRYKILKFIRLNKVKKFIQKRITKNKINNFEDKIFEDFREILKLSKEFTIKNNSKLYFVYLPEYHRYKTNYDNANYNYVKNIVDELEIPFIDIHKEIFKKEKNPLELFPYKLNGHYNKKGYKKIAETLYDFTKN
jgi:hypothetical protein